MLNTSTTNPAHQFSIVLKERVVNYNSGTIQVQLRNCKSDYVYQDGLVEKPTSKMSAAVTTIGSSMVEGASSPNPIHHFESNISFTFLESSPILKGF